MHETRLCLCSSVLKKTKEKKKKNNRQNFFRCSHFLFPKKNLHDDNMELQQFVTSILGFI